MPNHATHDHRKMSAQTSLPHMVSLPPLSTAYVSVSQALSSVGVIDGVAGKPGVTVDGIAREVHDEVISNLLTVVRDAVAEATAADDDDARA